MNILFRRHFDTYSTYTESAVSLSSYRDICRPNDLQCKCCYKTLLSGING